MYLKQKCFVTNDFNTFHFYVLFKYIMKKIHMKNSITIDLVGDKKSQT